MALLTGAAAPASASALCCVFWDDPFAGYSVFNSSGVRQVTGTWTQPAANCAGGRAVDFEVTVSSFDPHGPSLYAGVGTNVDCASGSPVYSAWYEVTGYDSRIRWADQVTPGDVLRGTVDHLGDKQFRFTLENLTRGWRKEIQAAGPRTPQGTQAGVERPAGGFPDFGSVPFTNVLQDGHPIGEYSPTAETADFGIIDPVEVIPGPLSDNKNFTPKFVHA
ncbi:G1 family glutamic endopeptidase [Amycolatopsis sp. NEAU-NG30]|uniref:G1 family glutamic endopeptidase n=1 Tax=Amycolatopsis melonis TaxID=3156488 RepID=A0ABV0LQ86_9PSEU